MGTTRLLYEPETRKLELRDRIEGLSVRPLSDSLGVNDHSIRKQISAISGLVFTLAMIVLAVATLFLL